MDGRFVDCHCHISAQEFDKDLEDVIQRSREAGVKTLVSVTEKASEFERVIQLSKIYPGLVAPCLGIHPVQGCGGQDLRSVNMQDLEPALPLFQKYREDIVAVGETRAAQPRSWRSGVLLVWTSHHGIRPTPRIVRSSSRSSESSFGYPKSSICLSFLHRNIHSRSAAKVTIDILKEEGISRALLHNFAGRPSVALEGVKMGYYFSFPPAVRRNEQRVRLIKQIPLEHICLETDSPALGPDKHVRNEPKNIALSCEYIAQVKGIAAERVIEATTQNALRLFPGIKRSTEK
ncbi:putative deoxyribonuclease tatdn3 isoform X1 [Conger conger]|uniref:putative deoxyribonuclease tatdn3 isoform X1 n=1 Tax=Conger conger TaxID=82655 RepID=UPI002A5AA6FE|nr:putative deoxyribonuclease tatdn3 isoform X1 [Conger conger]